MASKENKKTEFFLSALSKMSELSLSYQQGKIKYMQYAEKLDAIIDASGWSRTEFQLEIERRRKNLNNKF